MSQEPLKISTPREIFRRCIEDRWQARTLVKGAEGAKAGEWAKAYQLETYANRLLFGLSAKFNPDLLIRRLAYAILMYGVPPMSYPPQHNAGSAKRQRKNPNNIKHSNYKEGRYKAVRIAKDREEMRRNTIL